MLKKINSIVFIIFLFLFPAVYELSSDVYIYTEKEGETGIEIVKD